jgi:hypothetical protein
MPSPKKEQFSAVCTFFGQQKKLRKLFPAVKFRNGESEVARERGRETENKQVVFFFSFFPCLPASCLFD